MDNDIKWTTVAGGSGNGEWWDFDENKVLTGTYRGRADNIGRNKSSVHTVANDDGEFKFWGSKILNDAFVNVEEGTMVQIEYLGKAQGQNGEYKKYTVRIAQ